MNIAQYTAAIQRLAAEQADGEDIRADAARLAHYARRSTSEVMHDVADATLVAAD